jgi:hypothetical protein
MQGMNIKVTIPTTNIDVSEAKNASITPNV